MPGNRDSFSKDRFRGAIVKLPHAEPFECLPEGMQYITSSSSGSTYLKVFACALISQRLTWWEKVFPGADMIEPIRGLFHKNSEFIEACSTGAYKALGDVPLALGQKRTKHTCCELASEKCRQLQLSVEKLTGENLRLREDVSELTRKIRDTEQVYGHISLAVHKQNVKCASRH